MSLAGCSSPPRKTLDISRSLATDGKKRLPNLIWRFLINNNFFLLFLVPSPSALSSSTHSQRHQVMHDEQPRMNRQRDGTHTMPVCVVPAVCVCAMRNAHWPPFSEWSGWSPCRQLNEPMNRWTFFSCRGQTVRTKRPKRDLSAVSSQIKVFFPFLFFALERYDTLFSFKTLRTFSALSLSLFSVLPPQHCSLHSHSFSSYITLCQQTHLTSTNST